MPWSSISSRILREEIKLHERRGRGCRREAQLLPRLTLRFSLSLSLRVSVSALAMTGTTFTLLWMAFMNWTSKGLRLVGKGKQAVSKDQRNGALSGRLKRGRVSAPVAQRGDEVEAAVDPVVHYVSAVEATFVVEVALELVVDVGDDGAETGPGEKQTWIPDGSKQKKTTFKKHLTASVFKMASNQSWLLMASPYPGVSTTVRRSFTPLSSISTVDASI